MRHQQHIALCMTVLNFGQYRQYPLRDINAAFAARGSIPAGVGQPAQIFFSKRLPGFLKSFAFPVAKVQFAQTVAVVWFELAKFAEWGDRRLGSAQWAGINSNPGMMSVSLGKILRHLLPGCSEFRV